MPAIDRGDEFELQVNAYLTPPDSRGFNKHFDTHDVFVLQILGSDRPAVLIASDEGRPVYSRMGYLAVERWTAWLRPPR